MPKGVRIQWPREKMVQMYESGMCLREIGEALGQKPLVVREALLRFGVKMRGRANKGAKNGRWTGGRKIHQDGYVLCHLPDHPHANADGYVYEHRLVAEKSLGRYLLPTEVVHHKNDQTSDNRPENLQVFSSNGRHLSATRSGKRPNWSEESWRKVLAGLAEGRRRKAILLESRRGGGQSPQTTDHLKGSPDTASDSLSETASQLAQ